MVLTVLFEDIVLTFCYRWAQGIWGRNGIFFSARVFAGLTDAPDALVVSMFEAGSQPPLQSPLRLRRSLASLLNTLLKLSIGVRIR
jgi:hypothetical protein